MHAPGEAPPPGRLEDLVLLRVVEVLDGQPRHLLAERRLRLGLRVGLERPEVVLQAGDEGDVPEALRRVEGGEQVPHHGAVHRAILRLGRPADPRRDEHVGGIDAGERGPERFRVEQVGRDRPHAGDAGLRPACEAVDLPALGDEVRGQIVPHDAGHPGDDCSRCHEISPIRTTCDRASARERRPPDRVVSIRRQSADANLSIALAHRPHRNHTVTTTLPMVADRLTALHRALQKI